MIEDDEEMTEEDLEVIPTKTKIGPKPKPTETRAVVCPDCGCDYSIPLVKLHVTRSFAGNRLTVTWPSREGVNDTALLACPACRVIYRVNEDGSVAKSGNVWGGKADKKKGK